MTEFNPFAASDHDAAVEPEQAAQEDGRKTLVALALAGAAAIAIGAGAFFFLGGSGEDENLGTAAPAAVAPAAPAPAEAAPVAAAAPKLPPATKIALGRNPFRALYVEPAPAPAAEPVGVADAPDSAGPVAGSPAPGVVVVDGAAVPGSNGGPAAGQPPQQPTAKEHKLVLLRVFGTGKDQSASFSIDGKQQTAKVGTTFGPSAEILLLSLQEGPKDNQWTAVLQVGDGDPFDVVTGEPAYVR